MNKNILIGSVLLAAVAAGVWWQTGRTKPAAPAAKRPPAVQLAAVVANRQPLVLTANGSVTALERVELRPQANGVLTRLLVSEGSMVRPGQLLVQLDDASEQAALAKARAQLASDQAQLNSAERELVRGRDLLRQQFISQSALDTLQATADSRRATLAADRAQIVAAQVAVQQKQLRAQVAGRIGAISLAPGALVTTGMTEPVLTITRINPVMVSFTLPEQQLAAVRQAQAAAPLAVLAQDGSGGVCRRGELSFIDSAVDSASGNVLLKARFANDDAALWPGQFVSVRLQAGQYPGAAALPVAGLITGPDGQFAYAVGADHKAQQVPLQLLGIASEQAIVRGIQPGTKVIVSGGQNVRPGETVMPLPPRKPKQAASAASGEAAGGKGAARGGGGLLSCPPAANVNAGGKRQSSGAQ
ncbi:efflux RND transporter periplasmic adaptor subunit [Vogesella oryzae]|uniref:efflux RND transporter periplasmic adaptor subunit n=1 Tax=Vogesella oryzae TaxID=1735285 RepID=UPI001582F88F|nr:efflux RND transporter periplasmic adaptor subunit [Vogesella oryzae]